MRFADADVMAHAEGTSIPPLEVRLDLRPGDHVGLYEEVRHPSMGAGYSPLEVMVLDSPEPGWFIGATEDGQEVEFHAGNVADVLHGSPSMGGIFDWVKKLLPPSPGALRQQPAPPPPMLPSPSAQAPKESRGLIAQVKSFFAPLVPAKREGEAPKKSIFDVLKKPGGLPAQRGPSGMAPVEERPSIISVLKPGAKTVIPILEKMKSPAAILAPGEKKIIPFVEAITAPSVVIPASPEREPFEVRQQKQKELWSGIISPPVREEGSIARAVEVLRPTEEAARPVEEVERPIEMFAPTEIRPRAEVVRPPNLPQRLHRDIKILPMPRRAELLPSVEEMARSLMTNYHPIEELWEIFRQDRQSAQWKQAIEKYGVAKSEFETLGTCRGLPSIYEEISSYFHIPWEELRKRAVIKIEGGDEVWVNTDRIWMDIITPLVDRTAQAFNLIMPEDLPGEVTWERADVHPEHPDEAPCVLTLGYREGELVEEPEPRRYGGPSTEIEEAEEEELEPEDYEKEMMRLEAEGAFFIREREKLNPNDPEYRQKLAYIENELAERRAILVKLSEELSEMKEPRPKRAPSGKKKSKRTRKGK